MTDLRKAAEMALEALESGESFDYLDSTIAPALRQALAQSKREWVGLTRRELDIATLGLEDLGDCYLAIEAKLKEKNG